MVLVHGQEALVLGVLHVLLAPEQGELVLVGTALLVGAEHSAVAALVAHAVDVDDLMLGETRHLNGNVGAVGAHIAADLAHRTAAQAAGLGAVALVAAQRPLALVAGVLATGLLVAVGVLVKVHASDGAGDFGGVGNSLDHGGRTATTVARSPDALDTGGGGGKTATTVVLDARGIIQAGIDTLTHGADHRGGGKLNGLARGNGAATAACIRLAKLHNIAGQHGAVECLGSQQLAELNAIGKSKIELFLVGGHLLLGAAIHQAHVLHTSQTLGHAGSIHGGVAGANDHDVLAQLELLALLGGLEELQHVELGTLAQTRRAGHPGTGGHDHVGEALGLELVNGINAGIELHLGTKG